MLITKRFIPYLVVGIALYVGMKIINKMGWQIWALERFGFNKAQIKKIITMNHN